MSAADERIPTDMPLGNRPINLGTSLNDDTPRLDGVEKVTGQARYGRDVYPDDALFAAFIRCPIGGGTLDSIDTEAAEAVTGVVEVVIDRQDARYQGHPIGHIAASSPHALRRGLHALDATWRAGAVKTRISDGADDPDEPNDRTNEILAEADHVLEATYSTPVQTHSSLETHGCSIDYRDDSATIYSSTQGTFATRDGLDEAIGLPRSQYEVVCEYVGGGFGSKLNGPGREGVKAAEIASKYKRPVYLFVNRAEDHLDTGNRPSSRTHVRIGVRNDGTIIGGQIHTWGGVGVARGGGGVRIPSQRYKLGDIQSSHQNVQLSSGAPRPFRAPGSPQGAFAEELMLDEVAAMTDVDPLELRLKLETDADRRRMFELGARLIGWGDRPKTGTQTGVVRRGYGLGSTSWGRFPSPTEAEVVIHQDGSVESKSGTQDIGTGQRTVMGVIASTYLGVPLEAVTSRVGRSSLPPGPGSGGSVTAHNSAPAMQRAAEDAKKKLLEIVAPRLNASADDLDIEDGHVVRRGERVMTWKEATSRMTEDTIVGRGRWDMQSMRRDTSTGHSRGVQLVALDVDTETGVIAVRHVVAVQACGQVVCRKTAESQIIGGVIQGLSYALFEDKILDRNTGSMVNPNLEMYKILGTADMPAIDPVLWTDGQTGVRSLGEPPTIPTAGACAGAVLNAIGAPVRDLPLTPDRVLAALEGGAA